MEEIADQIFYVFTDYMDSTEALSVGEGALGRCPHLTFPASETPISPFYPLKYWCSQHSLHGLPF